MKNFIHALRLLKAERDAALLNKESYQAYQTQYGEAGVVALNIEIDALESVFAQSVPLYDKTER